MIRTNKKKLSRLFIIDGYIPKIFLAGIIGLCTGIVAILFHYGLEISSDFIRNFFTTNKNISKEWFALMPALGGLIVGLILFKITKTPEAAGQGTDNMIYAFHHQGGKVRKRVAPVKFITSIITLSSGGSAGYEGPMSQIGSGIANMIAGLFKMPRKVKGLFTLAGTAAGLGAIFKAPLAGALTSVEVLYREDFESGAFLTSIVSSVVAFSVYISFVGISPAIGGVPDFPFTNAKDLLVSALLGLFCIPFSFLYASAYFKSESVFKNLKIKTFLKPALGGLFVGGIILVFPEVAGGGFEFIGTLLHNFLPTSFFGVFILIGIVLAKILATALTVGSGGSGGVFGPSLFIGGVLGAAFGGGIELLFPHLLEHPETMILIGMGAFFAGAAKAPIAGVIMVCEMTGSYSLLPGLLIASVTHIAFSRKWSIYKNQVLNKFHSPAHKGDMNTDILREFLIKDVIKQQKIHKLDLNDSIFQIKNLIDEKTIYLVFHKEKYAGILDTSILQTILFASPEVLNHLLLSDCYVKAPILLDSMDLHSATKVFLRTGLSALPVKDKTGSVTGILNYSDILKTYDLCLKNIRSFH